MTARGPAGKAVILTGAAGGIGAAWTRALVRNGWNVVGIGRDGARLDALRDSLPPDLRSRLRCLPLDAGAQDAPSRIDAVLASEGWTGAALVNNAGLPRRGVDGANMFERPPRFWEVTLCEWQQAFLVNATAAFALASHVAPGMAAAGWGRIVNVGTSMHTMTTGGTTPYGPSKSALESLTSVMAADLEGTGVTANVLVPGGMVDTPFLEDHPSVPRDRMLRPEVMVAPLLHLLSDAGGAASGLRIVARLWDTALPPAQACEAAAEPVAWRRLAGDRPDIARGQPAPAQGDLP